MPVVSKNFDLPMKGNAHIENITERIQQCIVGSGLHAGILTIFVKHTTASIFIIEDEPGLREDTKSLWDQLIPSNPNWKHNTFNPGENNGHSHLRGQIQGSSLTIPFLDARLTLGAWQQIVMIDFDTRARTRQVIVQIMGE